MGGISGVVEASTMKELEKKVKAWRKTVPRGMMTVYNGWNPENVQKTENGYSILVHAHT